MADNVADINVNNKCEDNTVEPIVEEVSHYPANEPIAIVNDEEKIINTNNELMKTEDQVYAMKING